MRTCFFCEVVEDKNTVWSKLDDECLDCYIEAEKEIEKIIAAIPEHVKVLNERF